MIDISVFTSVTGIRVNPDGSKKTIPLVEFDLGDVILLGEKRKKFRITTKKMKLSELSEHDRFRFSPVSKTWHRVVFHGSVPLYYDVAVPFGEGNSGILLMSEPHVVVDALDFEEV